MVAAPATELSTNAPAVWKLPTNAPVNEECNVTSPANRHPTTALSRYLARFAIDSGQWHAAASVAAELDALRSLALFSFESAGSFCRPEVVESGAPFLDIKRMHHPCLANRVYVLLC